NDAVRGYISVEDRPRPTTAAALKALKAIDREYRLVMLTGDRRGVAESLGGELESIDEIHAELLPEQKLETVRRLEAEHGAVAMIGDGINDTPALAAARLGIAMGGAGSHQAMEIADVVLMQDDLARLPQAVRISRKTQRLIRENIALSLGLKLAFLSLAIPGLATLWMAGVADVCATELGTLNGMRMLSAREQPGGLTFRLRPHAIAAPQLARAGVASAVRPLQEVRSCESAEFSGRSRRSSPHSPCS